MSINIRNTSRILTNNEIMIQNYSTFNTHARCHKSPETFIHYNVGKLVLRPTTILCPVTLRKASYAKTIFTFSHFLKRRWKNFAQHVQNRLKDVINLIQCGDILICFYEGFLFPSIKTNCLGFALRSMFSNQTLPIWQRGIVKLCTFIPSTGEPLLSKF